MEQTQKKRPGRKKIPESERRVVYNVSLSPETVAMLRNHGNASRLVEELVKSYFSISLFSQSPKTSRSVSTSKNISL